MFNWTLAQELMKARKKLEVVTEAPEDDLGGPTDYAAAEQELDDADQDGQPDPGTETAEKAETEEADTGAEEENPEDLEAEDYTDPEGEGEEGEADTELGDTEDTGDEMGEEESVPDDNGDKTKNRYLIRDFIELYFTTLNVIEKLNNVDKTNLLKSKIYLQVSGNLTEMTNVLYDYITNEFSNKSYVFNLYQFNLFLEFINVNIEILKKSGELQSNQ